MKSHRQSATARSRSLRRLPVTLAVALLALLLAAPGAFAWHGNLVVRKVNLGGPAGDSFNFTLSKSPNQYQDVWNPATKTFSLTGASAAAGPFTEGTNQKTFSGLWAGYDSGYNAWVAYTVKEAAKAGYKTTIGCTIAGDWNSMIGGAIPGGYGNWTYTPGVSGGDPFVTTSVRWYNNVAYTTTCTFTNTYRSRIRVKKVFDDPIAANASVVASASGTSNGGPVSTSKTISESDAPSANVTDWLTVDGGSAASVGETDGSVPVSSYAKSLSCDNGVTGTPNQDGKSWAIASVPAGKDVTCTITNTRKRAKVKVIKYTDPVQQGGFDLQIDGATQATNVGNGGTTGWIYVEPGSHSARETATGQAWASSIPGWSSKWACAKNPTSEPNPATGTAGTATGSYTLAADDTLVCVFKNTKQAKLRVKKLWDVPAGTQQSVDMTIDGESQGTASAPTTFISDPIDVTAGSGHSYGETTGGAPLDPAKWQTTDLGCKNGEMPLQGAAGSVTVPAGGDVTCTIENRRRTAHIEVVKQLVPSNDGGQFELTINGEDKSGPVGDGGTTGRLELPTGSYTVDETGAETSLDDYDSTILCLPRNYDGEAGGAQQGHTATVDLTEGDDVLCTITNTRRSKLRVQKLWDVPAGTQQSVEMTIDGEPQGTANAPATFTSDPIDVTGGSTHSYGESELDPSLWSVQDLGCVDGETPVDSGQGSVTVPAGGDVTCTIKNVRRTGHITLRKEIVPSTDKGQFVLNAGANATDPLGNGGEQSFTVATGDYALSEAAAAGTNGADYVQGEPACAKTVVQETVDQRTSQKVPVVDGKVSVGEGDDVTCTWVNTRKGTVVVKKVAVDSAGAPVSGTFAFTGDLGALSVAANGDGVSKSVAPNASYNVTETAAAGFTLTKVACVDGNAGEGASSVSGSTATANVQPGETVVCTFTNTKNQETPGGSTGASGAVSPVGASGGTVARRGTAKLSGTVGCASAKYASATVSGRQIRRVTFYVNGKKVKTLTKPNAGASYQLRYRTKSLSIGTYKVRAKVEFTSASGTKAKTMSLQFSRCKVRSVSPQFTG